MTKKMLLQSDKVFWRKLANLMTMNFPVSASKADRSEIAQFLPNKT